MTSYYRVRNASMPTKYIVHPHYADENEAQIDYQPYRTTPLILPGAKVKKDCTPTESYLRHHPNPAMRGPVHHNTDDFLMKQRVADTVLHRVVGEDSRSGKVQHKQFNSPIGLYSDSNIENTIRQTVPQSGSTPIFIDLSFLQQKQKILEQQQQLQQQQRYSNNYPSYQPQSFNRPSSTSNDFNNNNTYYQPNQQNPTWRN